MMACFAVTHVVVACAAGFLRISFVAICAAIQGLRDVLPYATEIVFWERGVDEVAIENLAISVFRKCGAVNELE